MTWIECSEKNYEDTQIGDNVIVFGFYNNPRMIPDKKGEENAIQYE